MSAFDGDGDKVWVFFDGDDKRINIALTDDESRQEGSGIWINPEDVETIVDDLLAAHKIKTGLRVRVWQDYVEPMHL